MSNMQEYMTRGEEYILKTYNRYQIVLEKGEGVYLYDMNGKMVMENDTAINYSKIEMNANNEVCVTSDYECEIYTVHGVKKFSYTFDTQLYAMLYEDGLNNYIIIHEGTMDEVRLK